MQSVQHWLDSGREISEYVAPPVDLIANAKAELTQLDQQSIRPAASIAHAIAAGQTPDVADVEKLTELETLKVAQRVIIQEVTNA
jgi:hypothetical protein